MEHSETPDFPDSGSYPLSDEVIDEALTRTSPGNDALGYMDGGTFSVHEWVGMPNPTETAAWR